MKVNYKIAGVDLKVEEVEVLLGEASVEVEISAEEMVTQFSLFKEAVTFIKTEIPSIITMVKGLDL
jgi:hypothetical protein